MFSLVRRLGRVGQVRTKKSLMQLPAKRTAASPSAIWSTGRGRRARRSSRGRRARRRGSWAQSRGRTAKRTNTSYRVILSIAQIGSVKCFPEVCYFCILLAWAKWQQYFCQVPTSQMELARKHVTKLCGWWTVSQCTSWVGDPESHKYFTSWARICITDKISSFLALTAPTRSR